MPNLRLQNRAFKPKESYISSVSQQQLVGDKPSNMTIEKMNERSRQAHDIVLDTLEELGNKLSEFGFDEHSIRFSIGIK